jgi:hypothetical protein
MRVLAELGLGVPGAMFLGRFRLSYPTLVGRKSAMSFSGIVGQVRVNSKPMSGSLHL